MSESCKAGVLPDDHDCEECDCYPADLGFHQTRDGFCLACGGCYDPSCCGGHDDWCRFEPRAEPKP